MRRNSKYPPMKNAPCFQVSSFLLRKNIIALISNTRNMNAFSTSPKFTSIGFTSANIPKNNKSSMTSDPSKSPSPIPSLLEKTDFSSIAMSGIVVPIPMIVNATKYAGTFSSFAIVTDENTSHLPDSIKATNARRNTSASFQMCFRWTFFLIFPSVPSSFHNIPKYVQNAMTSIAPSGLDSCPSRARINGSIRNAHISSRLLVKMFGSSLTFRPTRQSIPRAKPTCTIFAPRMLPNPTDSPLDKNPVSELMISGADAAMAITTIPIIASDSPSLFA